MAAFFPCSRCGPPNTAPSPGSHTESGERTWWSSGVCRSLRLACPVLCRLFGLFGRLWRGGGGGPPWSCGITSRISLPCPCPCPATGSQASKLEFTGEKAAGVMCDTKRREDRVRQKKILGVAGETGDLAIWRFGDLAICLFVCYSVECCAAGARASPGSSDVTWSTSDAACWKRRLDRIGKVR